MSKLWEVYDQVGKVLSSSRSEASYSAILADTPGAFEIFYYIRLSGTTISESVERLAPLPVQQHIYVETCIEEKQLIDACEMLPLFIHVGYIPSSELLKKLIEQAMSPDTSPEAIAACQHVISQLKAVIYTFMLRERTSFEQSIFDDWDPISFWRLIHRILVTDDNEENGIPKINRQMLMKMIVMMMECAIYLNYEATAHALIGQSSAMERRHHSTLWLDWLPLVLEVDDIDLTLLDTCQELIHKLILFVYIECISPASMIKQLHNILRKLPIDRVYLFVESLKSPTFRCMYLNFFFHNCCSFSDTTASSHRYLADRPLDLLKITRLFFTSKALSHTSTWLSSEYTLRLLSLLLSSYMTSRGCARSPGIRSYSDTPWLVHGFSKDELALFDNETWKGIVDELTNHYEADLLVQSRAIIMVMSYIPKSMKTRLLQQQDSDEECYLRSGRNHLF